MLASIKSNRFFIAGLFALTLSGCMQELAESKYASSEDGYEAVVAKSMNEKIAKQIAANGTGNLNKNVPVQYTNPYAFGLNDIGAGYAGANVPVINNNAYGSLDNGAGVIQSGVFMPKQTPSYQTPVYGIGYPTPTQGR